MSNHLFDGLWKGRVATARLATMPDGHELTYADAFALSGKIANVLTGWGVKKGDRVAVQVDKSIEAAMLAIACFRSGAVFLPLNTAYTASEVDYFIKDAQPVVFVCAPEKASQLAPVAQAHGARIETLSGDEMARGTSGSLAEAVGGADEEFQTVSCAAEDLAAILYTSGTTGRSKGAMLSHDNLLSNTLALVDEWRFTEADVLLHALPIFHTHGLFVAINCVLCSGASMIFLPAFDVKAILQHLPHATTMMGVPTFYTRLLGEEKFTRELASHMRLFVSGSAPLLAETHIAFEARTGKRILERYGMTETNMNTSNPYDGERRAGTVGFPLPGVSLRICDPETGQEIADGEIGVLEVKGPNVFSGYWQMPEKTREEFRDDGFFITGDLGLMDEDGYVQIVGRGKDLIISGGYNIYPKEIELLLDEQNGVLESAVIGAPHPDFGEGVIGVLVAKDGSLDIEKIKASLAGQIARFKQPKHLVVVDELPRNTMGKVQKNVLRETYRDVFA